METGVAFSAVTTRNEGIRVTGKIGFNGDHPMIEHFRYLAQKTNAPRR